MVEYNSRFAVAIEAQDKTAKGIAAASKSLEKGLSRPLLQSKTEAAAVDRSFKAVKERFEKTWHTRGFGQAFDRLKDAKRSLGEFGEGLDRFGRAFSPAAGLAGLASIGGFGLAIEQAASRGASLRNLSGNIGVSTRTLQAWGGTAARMGISADTAYQSIENLSHHLYLARHGLDPFAQVMARRLNMSLGGSANDVMLRLSGRLKNFSPQNQYKALSAFGLEGLQAVIRQGPDRIREMNEQTLQNLGLTAQQIGELGKLKASFEGALGATQGFTDTLAAHLAPQLEQLLDKYSAWLDDLKKTPAALKAVENGAGLLAGGALALGLLKASKSAALLSSRLLTALARSRSLLALNWGSIAYQVAQAKPEAFKEDPKEQRRLWNSIFGGTLLEDDSRPGESWLWNKMHGVTAKNSVGAGQMFDYLVNQKHVSRTLAAGIVANAEAESTGRYGILGDHGTSGGLLQWHEGRFSQMAKAVPDWQSNWKGQLDYALAEMKANPALNPGDPKNAFAAGFRMSELFERPNGGGPEAMQRGALAKRILADEDAAASRAPVAHAAPEESTDDYGDYRTGLPAPSSSSHHVLIELQGAPAGTRASLRRAEGPASVGLRVEYAMQPH
jgi:Phage tail lysozyme